MSVDLGGCHCCMSPVLRQPRPKRVRAPGLCRSRVPAGTVLPYRLAAQQRGRSLCPAASSRRSPLPWQGARPAADSFSTAPVRCYRAVGSERRLRRKTRICWSGHLSPPAGTTTCQLVQLLIHDATALSDGGGRVPAAQRPVAGEDRVARFFLGLAAKYDGAVDTLVAVPQVNGEPGVLVRRGMGCPALRVRGAAGDSVLDGAEPR